MRDDIAKRPLRMVGRYLCPVGLIVLACAVLNPAPVAAEDSDKPRGYVTFRRGEFNQSWGVEDMSGLSVGWNFNRYLGVELAVDQWGVQLKDPYQNHRTIGEEGIGSFIPELRLRYPMFHDKFVPYIVAGFGGSFHQFNDRKAAGFGRQIDADWGGWAAAVGAGFDYFLADNIALNFEAKQIWHSEGTITVDDHSFDYNPSDWCATIGFRIYFAENDPKPLVGSGDKYPTRWYLGLFTGGFFTVDDQWESGVSWGPNAPAWGDFIQYFGGSAGVDLGKHWGLELTGGGGECDVVLDGVGHVSEFAIAPITAQIRYRFPIEGGRCVPFIMAGGGVCYTEANDYKPASVRVDFESEGVYPAFSVGAGVEYFIARNVSFSLESHYMYSWNMKYELNGREGRGDFSEIQVLLGLRLYLFEH